jgi:hypothetical protein
MATSLLTFANLLYEFIHLTRKFEAALHGSLTTFHTVESGFHRPDKSFAFELSSKTCEIHGLKQTYQ